MKNNEKIIFRLAKIDDAEKLVEIYAPYVKIQISLLNMKYQQLTNLNSV